MVVHWIACIWHLIGETSSNEDENWITEADIKDVHISRQYLISVYWTVTTLSTVGYGDISPVTKSETIFTIFIMVLGATSYAVTIGSATSIIGNFTRAQNAVDIHEKMVDRFCRRHNIKGRMWKKLRFDLYVFCYLWSKIGKL